MRTARSEEVGHVDTTNLHTSSIKFLDHFLCLIPEDDAELTMTFPTDSAFGGLAVSVVAAAVATTTLNVHRSICQFKPLEPLSAEAARYCSMMERVVDFRKFMDKYVNYPGFVVMYQTLSSWCEAWHIDMKLVREDVIAQATSELDASIDFMKSKQNFASSIPDLLRLEDSPSCDAAMSLFKDLFRSIDSAVVTSFLTAYECMQDSLQTFEEIIETVSGDDGTTANRIKFSASTKQGDMIFGLLTISQCLHRSLGEAASESRQQLKAACKELVTDFELPAPLLKCLD